MLSRLNRSAWSTTYHVLGLSKTLLLRRTSRTRGETWLFRVLVPTSIVQYSMFDEYILQIAAAHPKPKTRYTPRNRSIWCCTGLWPYFKVPLDLLGHGMSVGTAVNVRSREAHLRLGTKITTIAKKRAGVDWWLPLLCAVSFAGTKCVQFSRVAEHKSKPKKQTQILFTSRGQSIREPC